MITYGAAAPRSARGSSGRYGLCNRLSVLYFPFSETTPSYTCRVPGGDYEGYVDAHVRRLEALRRAGIVERIDA
ncbi:DUF3363 domain-containing protein, partial [Escherichia coli]